MSLEFDYQKLGSISDVKGGKRLPKGHSLINIPNSHPYIKVKDMAPDKLLKLTDNFEYIENETFNEISHYIVNKGDLIISIVGTIGLTNIIEYSLDNANLTENCAKITNLKKGYNVDYIYYFLNSNIGQNLIQESTVGAVQKKLPIKNIRDLNIPFPNFDIQNKIVDLLSTIDKKIENCKSINKNLTRISSNIFRSLVNNENVDEYLELNEICKFIKGRKPKEISDNYQSNFSNYLTIEALTNQNQTYAYDEKGVEANEYDILMVMDGASSGKMFYGKKGLVGSTLAKIDVKEGYQEIIFQFLKFNEKYISDNTTGSAIPHTDKGLILNLKCPLSNKLLEYSNIFKDIRTSIISNNEEIITLQKLRDTLLPNLMSGEIDVSKINCDLE